VTKEAPPARRRSRELLTKCMRAVAVGGLVCVLFGAWFVYRESRNLPTAGAIQQQFRNHSFPRRGKHWVALAGISSELRSAVVASEDRTFYRHHGFDFDETWEALWMDLRTRQFRRGGSTITQQVARNVYLSPEKTVRRKFREAILSWRIEQALSKDEILEVYLNVAAWGDDITGAESAAQFYFSKPANEVTWPEAALLAAILPNPHRLSPLAAREETRRLRQVVLWKLMLAHEIGAEEYYRASSEPLPRG